MGYHSFTTPEGEMFVLCETCGDWYSLTSPCKCNLDILEKVRRRSMFNPKHVTPRSPDKEGGNDWSFIDATS